MELIKRLGGATLALSVLLLMPTASTADGTDELMPLIGTDDYRLGLNSGTDVFVEIGNIVEHICITAGGSGTVDVQGPYTSEMNPGMFLAGGDDFDPDGSCLTPTTAGIHRVRLNGAFSSSTRWDISVCNSAAPMAVCDASTGNAAHIDGRVYSLEWGFRSSNNQTPLSTLSASVYARLLLNDAISPVFGIIQLQLLGFNGLAGWEVAANDSGVDGVAPPKSTVTSGNDFTGEYPIYIAPPDENFRPYSSITNAVSEFAFNGGSGMQMCTVIEPGVSTGNFTFKTTYAGRYRVICDLDDDGGFEATGGDDLVLAGDAVAQGAMGSVVNTVPWDGKDNDGVNVAAGDYDCQVTVSAGEFHYAARDMEVGFEGVRMFALGPAPASTTTGLTMFWDDSDVVPAMPIAMNDGRFPVMVSPAGGLDPGDDPNAPAVAYGDDGGGTITGNARGWGSFLDPCPAMGSCSTNGNGDIGDDDYMDTWAALASASSASVTVTAVGNSDCDMDGRTDQQEQCIDGTNPCGCTDAGTATPSSPDDECTMAAPTCEISGMVGTCVPCLNTAATNMTDEGCEGATPICKVDAMDSDNNNCVECEVDGECAMGEVCNQTSNECEVPPECTGDGECSSDTPVCEPASMTCVGCYDSDATNAADDAGCSGPTPHCDTSMSASGACVGCITDDECATGEECNASNECQTPPECMTDMECSGATPVCEPTSMTCVECTADGDCATGETCNASNQCEPEAMTCVDNSECSQGVCDTGPGVCVTCIDDGSGVDSGCSAAAPDCQDNGGVLTCVDLGDAIGGLSGGALCSFAPGTSRGIGFCLVLGLCMMALWRRRYY